MADVLVDNETRWKCLMCGGCCESIGACLESGRLSFEKRTGNCSMLSKGKCSDYPNRPVMCIMYPFHPSREDLALGIVDFSIGKWIIDSSCPGFGRGSKVVGNEKLMKELEKVASLLSRKINAKSDKFIDTFF